MVTMSAHTPKTTVVNLKHHKYDVYIGRKGKGHDGYFGNPIHVGRVCNTCGVYHNTPGDTLFCYKEYFYNRLKTDPQFKEATHLLKGLRLGCFCKPGPCHGDIIVEYLENEPTSENT